MVDLINLPYNIEIGPPPEKDNNWDYNPDDDKEVGLVQVIPLDLLLEGLPAMISSEPSSIAE